MQILGAFMLEFHKQYRHNHYSLRSAHGECSEPNGNLDRCAYCSYHDQGLRNCTTLCPMQRASDFLETGVGRN
jgi:hypothetical protein